MDDTPSEDVRTRLLAAAADYFRSPEYGILSDVAVTTIAERAGVPIATARRHFSVDELRQELIYYLLQPGQDPLGTFDFWILDEFEAQFGDSTQRVEEVAEKAMNATWPDNIDDPTMQAQMALWPYADGNPTIAHALDALYGRWEQGLRRCLTALLADAGHSVHLRSNWLSIQDFAVLADQLAEGMGVRARVARAAGRPDHGFSPEAPGRALVAILASMLQFHTDDEHPIDALFDRLHQERNQ